MDDCVCPKTENGIPTSHVVTLFVSVSKGERWMLILDELLTIIMF